MTQPDMDKLREVRDLVEQQFVLNPDAEPHAVSIGYVQRHGEETGEVGVIVKVAHKMSARALKHKGQPEIPPEIDGVRIDVQQAPVPHDQRLRLDQPVAQGLLAAFGPTGTHRSCMDCPIKGGCQIAPNKPWIGTLGGAVRWKKTDGSWGFGAITNAHVTGMNSEGEPMFQPQPGGDWFGKVERVVDLHFDGKKPNGIDAALINTFRAADGKYAGKNGGTVAPEQIELGRIKPQPTRATLGMRAVKTGRTTGTVRGKCVEIQSSTYVRYDEGTAYFTGQDVFRADSGNFSAGGDSGSLILTEDMRPISLLFAGSALDTVGCPIEWVLQFFGAEFY